jgi:hypothetical protein
MRPGRVVWAKVEGHDWWPARVVRRRAVPREVGPPPGGQVRTVCVSTQWLHCVLRGAYCCCCERQRD